jgi:hypothetical protein
MVKILYQDGGLCAFYKGLKPKLIQTVLNAGLMMVIYDKTFKTISLILQLLIRSKSNNKTI